MKNTKRPGWSRLDNAAKVFPALANKKDSRVFRFACQLTEPVQKKALQQAAEQALEEFPILQTSSVMACFGIILRNQERCRLCMRKIKMYVAVFMIRTSIIY